ncbi:MAG: leucyl aminopeptidase family protein [Planctomycetota bacterium]
MAIPRLEAVTNLDTALSSSGPYDAVIAVGPKGAFDAIHPIATLLAQAAAIDKQGGTQLALYPAPELAGQRLIFSPTGPVTRDQDDARCFADAAGAGAQRARDAGSTRPLLIVAGFPADPLFEHGAEVCLLGALHGLWQPLEAREAHGEDNMEPVETIGFAAPVERLEEKVAFVKALELGRRLSRDMGGSEPERMSPPRMAEFCLEAFAGTKVSVEVLDDIELIQRDYPLLSAVARASFSVPRHHPRIVRLRYEPNAKPTQTLFFAGKGLSYDTGGADIKAGGHMAGMSRDKGGGASVAGFMRTIAELAPDNLAVVAEIGCVRNSIGADCFVSDEIITSHAGCRVRIGNTDAEGRLVLADLLSHLREEAARCENARVLSVATLTGHSGRAVGEYSIALDNRPARDLGISETLSRVGDLWGDAFDISRLRREDWAFVRPRTTADDILSCNNAPSTMTSRGHQFPMAFLAIASGLDRHGADSDGALPYTHIDIGGSFVGDGDWQHGKPTAAPVVALVAAFLK